MMNNHWEKKSSRIAVTGLRPSKTLYYRNSDKSWEITVTLHSVTHIDWKIEAQSDDNFQDLEIEMFGETYDKQALSITFKTKTFEAIPAIFIKLDKIIPNFLVVQDSIVHSFMIQMPSQSESCTNSMSNWK